MLKLKNGDDINDADSIGINTLTYSGSAQGQNSRYYMKWNCGPATGKAITDGTNLLYGNSNTEPNNHTDGPTEHSRKYKITIQPDVQDWEACMMYITEAANKGFNDIWEGNYRADITLLHTNGLFVEFGGYEEAGKKDPGNRDATKQGAMAPINVAPRDVEATIDGVKYAPIAKALEVAEAGKTVKIEKATVEACTDKTLKKGVTIEALDRKTYTATADTVLDIAADGSITVKDLKPGTYTVSEYEYEGYVPQPPQSVTVVSGGTSIVTFSNLLQRGNLVVTKTSEDGLVEGHEFRLYGTSTTVQQVDMYAVSDSSVKETFMDVPVVTYTLS